jgi:alpha-galactosidase
MAAPLQQSVDITVRNALGQATRPLAIVCAPYGMTPTPPMGWNSWHVWQTNIDDGKIRAAADAMVAKGFAAHGYRYINIDDGWSGPRLADGTLPGAAGRFPDMKALGDYIHGKGLKYGIYASPGDYTCNHAKFLGSAGHEQQDASTWASWGVDYLKYDNCKGGTPERWRLMRKCLDNTGRDIVYSTNSFRDPSGNAQLWRTTVDIQNRWASLNYFGFVASPAYSRKYAGPGRYNDPDMLLVGSPEALTKENNPKLAITRNEEILHVTQWAMLAAPLLLGSNLSEADDALVALMCNDDVLDVNQDPLVRQGWCLRQDSPVRGGGGEVWMRPLFDGTIAVALYNRTTEPIKVKISWKELGLEGPQPVRDCWQRKDLGTLPQDYETVVQVHAAVLIKVGKPTTDRYLPTSAPVAK